jgi:hypothetical protein
VLILRVVTTSKHLIGPFVHFAPAVLACEENHFSNQQHTTLVLTQEILKQAFTVPSIHPTTTTTFTCLQHHIVVHIDRKQLIATVTFQQHHVVLSTLLTILYRLLKR